MKQLSSMLGLRYSGELSCGITEVLVVADDPNTPSAELLAGQKAKTAALWGNILIVRHQWLEDSAQRGALCDPAHYTLLPQKASFCCPLGQLLEAQESSVLSCHEVFA